jgi:cardiolipin synthase
LLDTVTLARAVTRIAGRDPRAGNAVRLLRDAEQNYPAWLAAIRGARASIHFENFIVADDATGRLFADALMERARAGVAVRVLYDWLGCTGRSGGGYWRELAAAGVDVRVFNPLQVSAPLWIRRDHRKVIVVDGALAFVSGLCVSNDWTGDPAAGVEPWRDTGVMVEGPAVADVDAAFAETWALTGEPLPVAERPDGDFMDPVGDVPVRVVAGRPGELGTYRLDLLMAASARRRLWLTDAYMMPTPAYVRALSEAARDGVDVRLLVPGSSDVPFLQPFVRMGYRPLIEAGVRVFEWNGAMLHAKTAVIDGRWSRVGSTNLNVTSWFTNWEIDVAVEDAAFAAEMEAMYLVDLANATEVVATGRPRSIRMRPARGGRPIGRAARRLATGAIGLGATVGAALSGSRSLTAMEARSIAPVGLALLALAALVTIFPFLLVSPMVIWLVWTALALMSRAWRSRLPRRAGERRWWPLSQRARVVAVPQEREAEKCPR